jgi:hypothetical protein
MTRPKCWKKSKLNAPQSNPSFFIYRVLITARIELQLMKLSLILSVFLSTACLCAAQESRTQFLPGQT